MRRFAIFALLVLAASVPAAHAARYPGTFHDVETDELNKLSTYLNGIHTLKSNFAQLGPQGELAQGEFDLSKPGRLRFSYNPPSPILVVATGGAIYVKNARLNTVDHTSLS